MLFPIGCHFKDFRSEQAFIKPSVVLNLKLGAIREAACRRTKNPRIFGSALHGADEDEDDSDLDLLDDVLPGATLFDLGGLHAELDSLLGVHVGLLTQGGLPPRFHVHVLAEAQPV